MNIAKIIRMILFFIINKFLMILLKYNVGHDKILNLHYHF